MESIFLLGSKRGTISNWFGEGIIKINENGLRTRFWEVMWARSYHLGVF